jgi:hypothetical protein
MNELIDYKLAIIEDDGEMMAALVQLLKVRKLYTFFDLDEAYRSILIEKNSEDIDLYIIDSLLPLPTSFNLPAGTSDYEAGIEFHKFMENELNKTVPTVFFTGATKDNPDMEKELIKYVDEDPKHRMYIIKPSSIMEIEPILMEVMKNA